MKRLFGAIAAAALLVAPLGVSAQGRGMGHGGGMRGAGGWHGASARGWRGGWRGGFRPGFRPGFRGRRFCCGFFPLGFGLGFAAAPWWWGDPWWGWGPAPAWGGWGWDDYDWGPPPPASGPVACGNWIWRGDQSRYVWQPEPCNAAPPPAVAAPAPPPPAPSYPAPEPPYTPPPRG